MTTATPRRKSRHECITPETRHVWHELSGWCVKGCGCRDDGRIVNTRSGEVIDPGPGNQKIAHEGMPLWTT